MPRQLRHLVLTLGLAAPFALGAGQAVAQQQALPPEYYTLDERGVDLVTGQFNYSTAEVVIGQPEAGGLAYGRVALDQGWRDLAAGGLSCDVEGNCLVSLDGVSEGFTRIGNNFTPTSQQGATLQVEGTGYLFVAGDGTIARFAGISPQDGFNNFSANTGLLTRREAPNGAHQTYFYKSVQFCGTLPCNGAPLTAFRLQSIRSNAGYQMHYSYEGQSYDQFNPQFFTVRKVVGLNLTVDYCDPVADECTGLTRNWQSVTYDRASDGAGGTNETATDELGRQTVYHLSSANELDRIRLPGQTVDQLSLLRDSGRVSLVNAASGQWTYNYFDNRDFRTTTSSGPQSQSMTVVSDLRVGRPESITDALNRRTIFFYDSQNRVGIIYRPEGDSTEFIYDARGNVVRTEFVSKLGERITARATYPANCANPTTTRVNCNKPTQTIDGRGNVTDYVFDSLHGGLTLATRPAPAPGQVRPQTRVTYQTSYAWYFNQFGVMAQAPDPMYLPIETSQCATQTFCAGTADEIRSNIVYGTWGVANNLLPTSITSGSGDGGLAAITALTYNIYGDLRTVDGPLPGPDDTTRYRYDEARQMTGMIGPDPDGAGPLRNRAMRMTYNTDGSLALSETGTTAGQGDPAWNAFTSFQQTANFYDTFVRPTLTSFNAGGVVYSAAQISYDASGRPRCSATRMNPAAFNSLPASACTPGPEGAFGPDRIVQTGYDAASQAVAVSSGVGTAAVLTEQATYTPNGQVATLTDGNGNVSTMTYDGFDRPSRITYPLVPRNPQTGPEYEEVAYDADSNVVAYRTRNNQSFSTTYDALSRPTFADNPLNVGDVAYGYDLLDRPISVAYPGGQSVAMTWDALGRQTSETNSLLGAQSMQYDLAGRRTRLTWPDGFFVSYGYDLTNAMTSILGNGTAVYAGYVYDDLGRRARVDRGNGVMTGYGYDPASRLTILDQGLAGTANDLRLTFTHNPAGQIVGRTSSNAVYDDPASAVGTTTYGTNPLNQTTTVDGQVLAYDLKGNLQGTTARTFTYDQANRLLGRTGSGITAGLSYDPLGRLSEMTGTQGARYLYDGAEISGIANPGTTAIINRIVRGPWPDEVAVVFPTTGAPLWNLQDERGSTIAITNTAGNPTNTLAYDDYGVPRSTNTGRFQYTGQLWLPDFGVYHYKSRAYDPVLGRFMQPDPIGYEAGLDLYAYVVNDPINFTDPLGLQQNCPRGTPPGEACLGEVPVSGRRVQSSSVFPSWIFGVPGFATGVLGLGDTASATDDLGTDLGEIVVTGVRPPPPPPRLAVSWAFVQARVAIGPYTILDYSGPIPIGVYFNKPNDQSSSSGNINAATRRQLMDRAQRDGYDRIERWKVQELGLNSRDQIYIDRYGNLYSGPRSSGSGFQPLGSR